MKTNFYFCETCHNLVIKLNDSGVNLVCCGNDMNLLEPQCNDSGIGEKHVPVCEVSGRKVHIKIGSELHPYTPEHHIEWIYLQTKLGGIIRYLDPNMPPKTCIKIPRGDTLEKVYIYCNLHGLWMCECNTSDDDECHAQKGDFDSDYNPDKNSESCSNDHMMKEGRQCSSGRY